MPHVFPPRRSSCLFLPWCIAARIRSRQDNVVVADLVIGFKMVRERFTSRVTLDPPQRIDVAYTEGPLRYLNNHWVFEPAPGGRSEEHTSELQSLMRISYAVFCLKKKTKEHL